MTDCLLIFLRFQKILVTPVQRPVLARSLHGTKITWRPSGFLASLVHVGFMFGSRAVHVLKHPSVSLYLANPSKSMKISRVGHRLPCCQWLKCLITVPAEELSQISWDSRRALAPSGEEKSCVAFGWDWNGQKKSSKWWLALSLLRSHTLPISPTHFPLHGSSKHESDTPLAIATLIL